MKVMFFALFSLISVYHLNGEVSGLLNVLGTDLKQCSTSPMTGYERDGYCRTISGDHGTHVVCALVTKEFLDFTKSNGNDLITPKPKYDFPGLKPGDKWCLCVLRWKEAFKAGFAPSVILESTHKKALQYVGFEDLQNKVNKK